MPSLGCWIGNLKECPVMKRLLTLLVVALLLCGTATWPVCAASATNGYVSVALNGSGRAELRDGDGIVIAESSATTADAGSVAFEVEPGQELFLSLGEISSLDTSALCDASSGTVNSAKKATAAQLADSDLFKLKTERDDGESKLVKASQYNEKALGGARSAWVKLVISDNQTTEEMKAVLDLTFSAREDGVSWEKGDYATLRIILWVSNEVVSGDAAEQTAGDKFVFQPVDNEQNTVEWEDVASLAFTANDDASKFYAKLSTKVDNQIYQTYGLPADADLFFRDFTGSPAISSTSRATLTLYYPWEIEKGPNPGSCYLYTINEDGSLTDITSLFTYISTDESDNVVNGWRMRTRTLGRYLISDQQLALESSQTADSSNGTDLPVSQKSWEEAGFSILHNTKPVPNTGI